MKKSIEPGQTAWMCKLKWLYTGGKVLSLVTTVQEVLNRSGNQKINNTSYIFYRKAVKEQPFIYFISFMHCCTVIQYLVI